MKPKIAAARVRTTAPRKLTAFSFGKALCRGSWRPWIIRGTQRRKRLHRVGPVRRIDLGQREKTAVVLHGVSALTRTTLALTQLEIGLGKPAGASLGRFGQGDGLLQFSPPSAPQELAESIMPLGASGIRSDGFAPSRDGFSGLVLVLEAFGQGG